jgi:hypothetical protein
MRRPRPRHLLWSAGGLVVAAALVSASSSAAHDPGCGEVGCRVEVRKAPWELLGVGIDMRVLRLAYETGGCWRGDPEITLAQGPSGIRIAIEQQRLVADEALPCEGELSYRVVGLNLRTRVAGRRLTGGPRVGPGARFAATRSARVPRVLDLWVGDARRALRFQGLGVRELGNPDGTVAFQSPLAGKPARRRAVRLTIGRNLFAARRLDRCLERAGIPTHVRRPRPGDADAPDLVLWPRHPSAQASIGFYADPVRAREHEAIIRKLAKRFNGLVERRRLVTIVWYAQPAAEPAARTRRCVYGKLGRPT